MRSAAALGVCLLLCAGFVVAQMPLQPSPEGAEVYIIAPADGETVSSPFLVQFGLKGMGIAPAGIEHPNTGHHHLLIDVDQLPEAGVPMPATDNIRHFGGGQTETELTLPAGEHTLRLVLGDHLHFPHDPAVVSDPITIHVR